MSRRQKGGGFAARLMTAVLIAAATAAPLAGAAENEPGQRLPRFVSLRSDQVNLRVGPGENYPIE